MEHFSWDGELASVMLNMSTIDIVQFLLLYRSKHHASDFFYLEQPLYKKFLQNNYTGLYGYIQHVLYCHFNQSTKEIFRFVCQGHTGCAMFQYVYVY